MSLTTDGWFAKYNKESFLSLTGHWISREWERYGAVLACRHFPGEHTGKLHISYKFSSRLVFSVKCIAMSTN